MANLNRICVPLSLDCNLHCKYCYRDHDIQMKIPEFSKEMIDYLRQLSPDVTEAVIASGGEPLLHWDKVQELFSYVPKGIHKKILTNGMLLTQEKVNYINDNEIEVQLSHDGPNTKFLRGINILEDDRLRKLAQQIKILKMVCVITKFNSDIWENFFDTAKKLERCDFNYFPSPLLDSPDQNYLVDGMNYQEWFTTWSQFFVSPYHYQLPWYFGKTLKKDISKKSFDYKYGKRGHFNVLPDGTVCEMQKVSANYGKIWDDFKDIYAKMLHVEEFAYCVDCEYNDKCNINIPCYSTHTYKIRTMQNSFLRNLEKRKELRRYVWTHIGEIEQKYNVNKVLIGANYDKNG